MRQTHSHGHFGYSKHGQGNGAMVQMDDNNDRRGDQWVGIGYTASSKCAIDWLVGLGFIQWRKEAQTQKISRHQSKKQRGRGGRGLTEKQMSLTPTQDATMKRGSP